MKFSECLKFCKVYNSMRLRLFKTLRPSSPSCKYSFIHTTHYMHPCTQISKYIHMKTDSFLSMTNALLNFKPQPSGCILVTAHFTASPRNGLERWWRVQWLSKNWLFCRGSRKPCKFWATVPQQQTDRQTGRPRLWITKGPTGQQLYLKPLKSSGN